MGLAKGWDIGLSLPQILSQSVQDTTGSRGEFVATGGTEVRLNTKIRLLGDDSQGFAFVFSTNFNRIQNNPYTGTNAGPTVNIEAAADTTIKHVALGANVGYRARNPGTKIPGSIANPLKDQLIASVAASYLVSHWNTKIIGEIFASLPAQATNSNDDRSLSSAEALLGAKYDLNTSLALHAGFGGELSQGLASPDWRVYTGLNYTFGPTFKPIVRRSTKVIEPPDNDLLVQLETEQTDQGAFERFRTQAIHFKFDSDEMVGEYAKALDELSKYLRQGFKELVVEGHTDSIGSEIYNDKLSLKRAQAIKRYLVSKYSLDATKITPIGYGERHPIADNGNYQGRQANRRVEFKIRR